MRKNDIIAGVFRVILDFLSVGLAWYLAYFIRPYADLIPFVESDFLVSDLPALSFFRPFSFIASTFLVLLFALLGYYKIGQKFDWVKELFRIIFGVFLWGMLIVSYFSLVRHEPIFSRVMLYQGMLFSFIIIYFLRIVVYFLMNAIWQNGKFSKKVLLFGGGKFLELLEKNIPLSYPYILSGIVTEDQIGDLEKIAKKLNVDEIWQVSPNLSPKKIAKIHEISAANHFAFRFIPNDPEGAFIKMNVEFIGGIPVFEPVQSNLDGWGRVAKRFFDIIVSSLLIILLIPFFLIIIAFIKLDSAGPIFFIKERVGKKGKSFKMIKFRSMIQDADKKKEKLIVNSHRQDGPFFKIKNDPRITKFGKFLRRFSIDELPQLFNVLMGDMSLTGPRPHFSNEIEEFTASQKRILRVRPGITGLSQVSGRSDLPFKKEIELDLFFIQNWSFLLEVKILFKTFWVVLCGKGAD